MIRSVRSNPHQWMSCKFLQFSQGGDTLIWRCHYFFHRPIHPASEPGGGNKNQHGNLSSLQFRQAIFEKRNERVVKGDGNMFPAVLYPWRSQRGKRNCLATNHIKLCREPPAI